MIQKAKTRKIKDLTFQHLGEQSPEPKPFQNQPDQIDEFQLQTSQIKKHVKRSRRRKQKTTQTNIIKIHPIDSNDQQIISPQIPKNQQAKQQYDSKQYQSLQNKVVTQNIKQKTSQKQPNSVIFVVSDDSQQSANIPQSSKRPLNQKRKQNKQTKQIKNQKQKQKRQVTEVINFDNSQDDQQSEQYQQQESQQQQDQQQYNQQQSNGIQPQQRYTKQSACKPPLKIAQNQLKPIKKQLKPIQNQVRPIQKCILKSSSFYTLINAQIPQNNFITCLIKRKQNQSIFDKTVTYQCFLLQQKKYLITCMKDRWLKGTSHFQFYRTQGKQKVIQHNLYGNLDSNFSGTQYVFKTYPKTDTDSQKSTDIDRSQIMKIHQVHQSNQAISTQYHKSIVFPNQQKKQTIYQPIEVKQTCFMSFKANLFGLGGQRSITMLKKKNKRLKKTQAFSDLKSAQQTGDIDKFHEFLSRKAISGKNGLQLDFKGIAKMQSTKNVILQNQTAQQIIAFGKIKDDIYSVSIGYPLSIIEGLAFSVANLDRKFFVL